MTIISWTMPTIDQMLSSTHNTNKRMHQQTAQLNYSRYFSLQSLQNQSPSGSSFSPTHF